MPEFFKYVALGIAAIYFVIWITAGSSTPRSGNVEIYYFIGWVLLLSYLPLYWYRVYGRGQEGRAQPAYGTGDHTGELLIVAAESRILLASEGRDDTEARDRRRGEDRP